MSNTAETWFAVANVAANEAFVTSRLDANIWSNDNPTGWTYQEVRGFGGTILGEFDTQPEAEAAVDTWLARGAS